MGDPERKHQTEQASQKSNQDTFSQQLAHKLAPSGADRKPDRHFARAGRRAGELQIGDIGTGDQQQKSHGAKEQSQASLHLSARCRYVQIVR